MDLLKQAAVIYKSLINKEYHFVLSGGAAIRVIFKADNFKHLAGLHKLSDLYWFASEQYPSIRLLKMVLRDKIMDADLTRSRYFDDSAKNRLMCLYRISELFVPSASVVFPFDSTKSPLNISIKSQVLFFKPDSGDYYITFGAAQDASGLYYYPETLFYRQDDAYITGQNIQTISSVEIRNYRSK